MSKIVISVKNLSKKYIISHKNPAKGQGRYLTLRDTVAITTKNSLNNFIEYFKQPSLGVIKRRNKARRSNKEDFWALKNVSFNIQQGERIGIIGRNGAGKTTLLKLLSRITEPTEGQVRIKGRVACLLEVGTGFHPELTGRENIYLNGAILGMTRQEVRSKFDEIIDFAGVEQFLDTPVKRYSSGMHVRLGFAVAAHLEPEILVVDEVLSVGDALFQKKCIGKMTSVAKEGRTVLFVSHQMQAVTNLCNRAILLDKGRVVKDGETGDIINTYLSEKTSDHLASLKDRKDRQGNGKLKMISTWIEDNNGDRINNVMTGMTVSICVEYEMMNEKNVEEISVAYSIDALNNLEISVLSNVYTGDIFRKYLPRKGIVRCQINRLVLNRGIYTYNIMMREKNNDILDYITIAGKINVTEGDYFGTGKIIPETSLVFMEHKWKIYPSTE